MSWGLPAFPSIWLEFKQFHASLISTLLFNIHQGLTQYLAWTSYLWPMFLCLFHFKENCHHLPSIAPFTLPSLWPRWPGMDILGWPWTMILPISQVSKIAGVSHWHPVLFPLLLEQGGSPDETVTLKIFWDHPLPTTVWTLMVSVWFLHHSRS
jgi:hypothetical protein